MSIYQEELSRILPKIGCEGIYDKENGVLCIQYENSVLGFQNSKGDLNFSRELLNEDANKKLDDVIEQMRHIREYADKYLCAPNLEFEGVKEYKLLAEYGDTVLAAKRSENHGFMFCTWKQDKKHSYVTHGDYSQNYDYAKESFVTRAGLIEKNKLFSLSEAKELYRSISFAMENCETLTYEQERSLKDLLEKLTWGYPELEENPPCFECAEQHTEDTGPNML